MSKLREIDREALLSEFHDATDPKAVKRLVMAIAYLDGVPVTTLSERYDIPRSTIYTWLDRFEDRSIDAALRDETRPGRPPALEPSAFVDLAYDIEMGPQAHGFDADEWTADLLQAHVSTAYDVEYSEGHARRLLRQLDPEALDMGQ